MAKPNAGKVNPHIAEAAFKTGKDRQALYGQCVIASFRSNGRMDCGFDAKDLMAWLAINHADDFDAKGKRINHV